MTTWNKPLNPLPWKPWTKRVHHEIIAANDVTVAEVRQCEGPNGSTAQDAAYIAHACTAYPQLVARLEILCAFAQWAGERCKHTDIVLAGRANDEASLTSILLAKFGGAE